MKVLDRKLSPTEEVGLRFFLARGSLGGHDDELAEVTGLAWGTAKSVRTTLHDRGLIAKTARRRATRTGSPAWVYAIADQGSEIPVPRITLSLEKKLACRTALFEMVKQQIQMGLSVDPDIILLGQWLDSKVILAEKRCLEQEQDQARRARAR